jgi:hypothetical protein
MKFDLPDAEVKLAVANYTRDILGINTEGKDIHMTFSATRKEGLIASVAVVPEGTVPATGKAVKPTKPAKAKATVATPVAAAVIPGYNDNTAADAPALAEPVVDPVDAAIAAQDSNVVEIAAPSTEVEEVTEINKVEDVAAPVVKSTATLFGKPAA